MAEAGVTLSVLLDRLYKRGYDYLDQDAEGRELATAWINEAYAELCLEELWPFRLTTVSGATPLEIADVDQVMTVIDSSNDSRRLYEKTETELTASDLAHTGSNALWFYRDSLTVKVWPASGTTISVRYWRLPTELTLATDETIIPKRYAGAIVDGAVIRAAAERDNPEAADLADRMYQRSLALMRRQLRVAPKFIEHVPFTSEDE